MTSSISADSVHSHGSKDISDQFSNNNNNNNPSPISKIITSGDGDEFIIIGNQKFYKHELMTAFGGSLNPGLAPYPTYEFGNAAPVGLCAFAMTTLVLSFCNARAMGVTNSNVVLGLTCFYGGAVQFLAGCWEMVIGNVFGGTALTSYGAFWLSFAAINLKAFNIAAAYTDEAELANALGFFLLGWALFTFMLCLVTLKSTVAFFGLFLTLALTFVLLAAGEFTGHVGVTRGGGVMGVITAFFGFYNSFAGVANKTNSYFIPLTIPLTRST